MMNTLNNIHALIDIDADSAKRGIVELSDMMRYVVYESTADHIPLRRDIEFLETYVELMRIRYSQNIDVRFNYPPNLPHSLVLPPLVLIVFVENAFKHGISRKGESYIYINISVDDQYVVVNFDNSLFEDEKRAVQGGVGLENVSRRLEHIYGDKYSLKIDKEQNRYSVTLKLPIDYEY